MRGLRAEEHQPRSLPSLDGQKLRFSPPPISKLDMNTGSAMRRLKPYIRDRLDVLFVALNPPAQSSSNGHWFSGKSSRFFHLLHQSDLIIEPVKKEEADEIVFGSTTFNYKGFEFGVIDLVHDLIETNSNRVRPTKEHVDSLLGQIRKCNPRFVCVIHSKVRSALQRHGRLEAELKYGECGAVLTGSDSCFFVNYFPNGNNICDDSKLQIFRTLREALTR